jgi:glucose-1-phosphate thymidylyltransferase
MRHKGIVVLSDMPSPTRTGGGGTAVPALEAVANRPIICHVVDALLRAGVHEVVLAGARGPLTSVRNCMELCAPASARFEYAVSDRLDVLSALRAAAPLVGKAPCVVHAGDGLLDEPLTSYLEALVERDLDLILLCSGEQAAEPLSDSGGLLEARPDCVSKAPREPGIGIFAPAIFQQACQVHAGSTRSGLAAIAEPLSAQGRLVRSCEVDGWRRYHGNPSDLLEVNRLALELLPPDPCSVNGHRNRIEGQVHLDQTASVRRSVLIGPVIVGPGAKVTNAYIGPYTSIGAQATIEGVEIERSIVSAGATIMHVGTRLVSSLVGKDANVFRDFSLPRAMRLRVSDGDEVALC